MGLFKANPLTGMLPDLMAHFTWPQLDDEFPSAAFNVNSSGAVPPSGQSLAAEKQVSSATQVWSCGLFHTLHLSFIIHLDNEGVGWDDVQGPRILDP